MKEISGYVKWFLLTALMTGVVIGIDFLLVGNVPVWIMILTFVYDAIIIFALYLFFTYIDKVDKNKDRGA